LISLAERGVIKTIGGALPKTEGLFAFGVVWVHGRRASTDATRITRLYPGG